MPGHIRGHYSKSTLHAIRKSNMYDSHYTILYTPIRAYTTFSNSALLCDPVLDISCLTRDRVVHHPLRYKHRFHGDVSK